MSNVILNINQLYEVNPLVLLTVGLTDFYSKISLNRNLVSNDHNLVSETESRKLPHISIPSAFKVLESDQNKNTIVSKRFKSRGPDSSKSIVSQGFKNRSLFSYDGYSNTLVSELDYLSDSSNSHISVKNIQNTQNLNRYKTNYSNDIDLQFNQHYSSNFSSNLKYTAITLANRYFVIKHVGSGEFCNVYLAVDKYKQTLSTKTNSKYEYKLVVVKCMKAGDNIIGMAEFLTLQKLNKKKNFTIKNSIINQYELFKIRNRGISLDSNSNALNELNWSLVLVLEPLTGGTLIDALKKKYINLKNTFADPVIFEFYWLKLVALTFKQILSAACEIHNLSIVHSDLKPENIIFTLQDCDQVKIVDFGNAVKLKNIHYYYKTFEIQPMWYRAPEVAYYQEFDEKIDIWSLGCILCEMICLYPIFKAQNNHSLLSQITMLLGPLPSYLLNDNSFLLEKSDYQYSKNQFTKYFSDNWYSPNQRKCMLSKALNINCPELLTFVDSLLHIDPKLRISAKEGLENSFFKKYLIS
ncbi:hypothetical protein BB561_003819 [Smittium simulii]|uniref:Protein kinase domain-containing protein n=1 Tax=Smittium simulii TaxID=133385 RepID=A0A2T9YJE2_9FUNG|nr:hypothetical protein BB561_003819 [Smittium simulii]